MWDHTGAEPGKTWACQPSCSNAKLIFCSLGQRAFVNWALPCLASIRQEPFAPYGNGKPRLSRFSFKYGLGHKRIPCIRQSFQQKNIWENVRMEAVSTPNCIPTLVVKVWIQMVLLQKHRPGRCNLHVVSLFSSFQTFLHSFCSTFLFYFLFLLSLFHSLLSSGPFIFFSFSSSVAFLFLAFHALFLLQSSISSINFFSFFVYFFLSLFLSTLLGIV